jgi:hypothetical protein
MYLEWRYCPKLLESPGHIQRRWLWLQTTVMCLNSTEQKNKNMKVHDYYCHTTPRIGKCCKFLHTYNVPVSVSLVKAAFSSQSLRGSLARNTGEGRR